MSQISLQEAYNNVECRFISTDRQLMYLEEWEKFRPILKERLREGEEFNVPGSEGEHGKIQEELG